MRTDFGGAEKPAFQGTGSSGGGGGKFGGADKCPRCSKSVYAAEKVIAAGSVSSFICFYLSSCADLDDKFLKAAYILAISKIYGHVAYISMKYKTPPSNDPAGH